MIHKKSEPITSPVIMPATLTPANAKAVIMRILRSFLDAGSAVSALALDLIHAPSRIPAFASGAVTAVAVANPAASGAGIGLIARPMIPTTNAIAKAYMTWNFCDTRLTDADSVSPASDFALSSSKESDLAVLMKCTTAPTAMIPAADTASANDELAMYDRPPVPRHRLAVEEATDDIGPPIGDNKAATSVDATRSLARP